MTDFDQRIKDALASSGEPPVGKLHDPQKETAAMLQVVANEHQKKMRRLWFHNLLWHLFFIAALLIGVYYIFDDPKSNEMTIGLFVCMAALSGAVAIKSWFWVIHSRLRIETQLKEMELSFSEMKEMLKEIKNRA